MGRSRYPQFCALARAAEVLGERWTLLIARELLLSPKRFSDLRRGLDGISASVLAERLEELESEGLVRRSYLEPPAASWVYELTPDGAALRPAVLELIRWGARRLLPPRPDEQLDPAWIRLALEACARRDPVPPRRFALHIPGDRWETQLLVTGGPAGTTVTDPVPSGPPLDAALVADPRTALGLAAGVVPISDALADGRLMVEGDRAAAADFPTLFRVTLGGAEDHGSVSPS